MEASLISKKEKSRQKGGSSQTTAEKPSSNSALSLSSNDSKSHGSDIVGNDLSKPSLNSECANSCPSNPNGNATVAGPLLSFKGAIANPEVVAATLKMPLVSKDSSKCDVKEEETIAPSAAGSALDKNKSDPPDSSHKNEANSSNDDSDEIDLERFRKGWTKETAGNMTMAEIYLLFDAPKTIILEYEWTDVNPQCNFMTNNLNNVLRRLVHIAITEFVDVSRSKSVSIRRRSMSLLFHLCN